MVVNEGFLHISRHRGNMLHAFSRNQYVNGWCPVIDSAHCERDGDVWSPKEITPLVPCRANAGQTDGLVPGMRCSPCVKPSCHALICLYHLLQETLSHLLAQPLRHQRLGMRFSGASNSPHHRVIIEQVYVSFGQGSSLLWTHTLRPFCSRPISLTQEGRSLVNDVCVTEGWGGVSRHEQLVRYL